MIPFLNIVCYKWGTLYPAEEVNILKASVKRNLSIPHKFHCVTDDGTGLDPDIAVLPLPTMKLPGNGPKIFNFSDKFLGLTSQDYVVCLDIDLVIVGSLDFLGEDPEKDFVITKHRASHSNVRAHGAVYRVRVGSKREIWDDFVADPFGWADKFPGQNGNNFSEQKWLEYNYRGKEYDFFPYNKILIFRKDCNARAASHVLGRKAAKWGLTTAWLGEASLPGKGEAIVSFSGLTNPRDVKDSHHGHLRRAPFIAEHWRL